MKTTILGAGLSGISVARLLVKLGQGCFLSEKGSISSRNKYILNSLGVPYEEGGHSSQLFTSDRIITSPGIPDTSHLIKKIKEKEVPFIGEFEFGSRYLKGLIIAITGTNGKTTVSYALTHILRKYHHHSVTLAGNVGKPVSDYAFSKGIYVLEVSSFQLAHIKYFKPDIAVILNLVPDHIDWHGSFESYKNAKLKILKNIGKKDSVVIDRNLRELVPSEITNIYQVSTEQKVKGAYIFGDGIYINLNGKEKKVLRKNELPLFGQGNLQNILFVIVVSALVGVPVDKIHNGILSFKGLPHRLEFVEKKNGISIYNDSKATNPSAVLSALKSFEKNVILIMGGLDKELDFSILIPEISEKCRFLIVYGAAGEKLRSIFDSIIRVHRVETVGEAVRVSFQIARKGDTVLFSPGCTSFDLYKNYIERGEDFKRKVISYEEENT